jgi:cytoskeletal protein CcmA (bactofilin family)
MFGSRKTTPKVEESQQVSAPSQKANVATTADPNALNSLVRGTVVEGTVVSENDIRIDGTIKGVLVCKAKVIIGPSGFIDGEIRCANAVIEGKFTGKLKVDELLSIKENAEVVGDVVTGKLLIQPGAIFNVTCNTKENKESVKPSYQSNGQAVVA